MDRGVSMPNMLEPKASIFFFLYSLTIATERCFKIYTMFVYISAFFFTWKEERVLRALELAHWHKGNPKTTHLVWGNCVGKNRALSEHERLSSAGFLIKHAASGAAESLALLACWLIHAHLHIALTQSGWILYVAYSRESNAQTFIQTTHITKYCIVYV